MIPFGDDVWQFIIRKHLLEADPNPLRNFRLSVCSHIHSTFRQPIPLDASAYLNSKCVKIIRLIDCDQEHRVDGEIDIECGTNYSVAKPLNLYSRQI